MQESLDRNSTRDLSSQESAIGSPSWLRQLNNIATAFSQPSVTFSKEQREVFQQAVERVLSPIIGRSVAGWFSVRERLLHCHEAPKDVVEYARGNPKAERIVIYVPGMFDLDCHERMNDLYDRSHPNLERDLNKEGWIALDWLYSGRDLERIHMLQEHLLTLAEEHLARGASVRLLGYSVGGLIAKTVTDSLAEKYPGHLGLVVHNCPLDPAAGFFVRWANMKRVQGSIAYEPRHAGTYPIISLGGDKDGIVPHSSTLKSTSEDPIKNKLLPESRHRDPCSSPKAQDRIGAALRSVSIKMPEFPRQRVSA